MFESILEFKLACMLLARRDVCLVEDQPRVVRFVDKNGKNCEHTFDFLVLFSSGKRIAIAVKPSTQVRKSGIREILQRIREQSLSGFADEALLMTEKSITNARAWNAGRIIRARRMRNDGHCAELSEYAQRFYGAVSVSSMIAGFEEPSYGLNAVWCLIYDGILKPVEPETRLHDHSLLRVVRKLPNNGR